MTEEIRRAVMRAISERFGLPIYGQSVPQGGKRPCFTVEIKETEQKRLLGRRAARRTVCEICYYGRKTAAEASNATEGLYEALAIIGNTEKFAAGDMRHERTADGVKFTAVYEYHVLLAEADGGTMERLELNGRELVGDGEGGI